MEIFGDRTMRSDGVAHSAHLGGLLAGLIYYKLSENKVFPSSSMPRIRVRRPAWMKVGSGKNPMASTTYSVNFSNRESIQAELDRILDKIRTDSIFSISRDPVR